MLPLVRREVWSAVQDAAIWESTVAEASVTVADLVARFALRSRASTESFHAGVRLARSGKVTLISVTNAELSAIVSDPQPLEVALHTSDAGELAGRCACGVSFGTVCRHQVAAAHALWAGRDTGADHRRRSSVPRQPDTSNRE